MPDDPKIEINIASKADHEVMAETASKCIEIIQSKHGDKPHEMLNVVMMMKTSLEDTLIKAGYKIEHVPMPGGFTGLKITHGSPEMIDKLSRGDV